MKSISKLDVVIVALTGIFTAGMTASVWETRASLPTRTEKELVLEKIKPMEVFVGVITAEGFGNGSGVFLTEDGYIATCAHVAEKVIKLTVETASHSRYDAVVVYIDTAADVAILKIKPRGKTHKEKFKHAVRAKELVTGEDVYSFGNPLGFHFLASSGIYASGETKSEIPVQEPFAFTTLQAAPGSSGSGVLSASGELIGLVDATAREGTLTLLVPQKYVWKALEAVYKAGGPGQAHG